MRRLILRVDASVERGLGHLLRQVALAEAARARDLEVAFVAAPDPIAVGALAERGEEPLSASGPWLDELSIGDVVVLDGAHLLELADQVAERGARVAVVDDAGGENPSAQVVVVADQPPGAPVEGQVRLHGPAHALVRAEFRAWRGRAAEPPTEVLVAVGGTDPDGHLPALMAAVGARLGGADARSLRAAARGAGGVAIAMAGAGLAVSAAGMTAWELLCVGVPSALVVAAVDQQAPAALIAEADAAVVLGSVADAVEAGLEGVEVLLEPSTRAGLRTAGMDLVDGRGAERLLNALQDS